MRASAHLVHVEFMLHTRLPPHWPQVFTCIVFSCLRLPYTVFNKRTTSQAGRPNKLSRMGHGVLIRPTLIASVALIYRDKLSKLCPVYHISMDS